MPGLCFYGFHYEGRLNRPCTDTCNQDVDLGQVVNFDLGTKAVKVKLGEHGQNYIMESTLTVNHEELQWA